MSKRGTHLHAAPLLRDTQLLQIRAVEGAHCVKVFNNLLEVVEEPLNERGQKDSFVETESESTLLE